MRIKVWPFRFNTKKAIQAVAILLRHADANRKRDNYTRILKLLYLAERECFVRRGRPLLGDEISAMPHGPVLSSVYDLILNRHFDSSNWNQFIAQDRFDITLTADPDNDQLSPFEIKLLEQVADEHAGQDQWQLIDFCHNLPEWIACEKPTMGTGPQSIPIPIDILLDNIQVDGLKDRVLAWAREQWLLDRAFLRAS